MDQTKHRNIAGLISDLDLNTLLIFKPESVRYLTEVGPMYSDLNFLAVSRNPDGSAWITSAADFSSAKKSDWKNILTFDETNSEHENRLTATAVLLECLRKFGDKHEKLRLGVELEYAPALVYQRLKDEFPRAFCLDISEKLRRMRIIKTSSEIVKIKKAVSVGDEVISTMRNSFREGRTELEIASDGVRTAFRLGAEKFLWTAVMIGSRAALVGAGPTDTIAKKDDIMLVDFGFIQSGYVCDITRTFALGEVPPEIFRMHRVVSQTLEEAIKLVRPEMPVKSIVDFVQTSLLKNGLSPVPHDIGHGIGLEGHERPIFNEKEDIVLQPGMTVALEPGAYKEGLGGVRVEDEVLITQTGCEVLTKSNRGLTD